MHIRLAALIIVFATLILSYNSSSGTTSSDAQLVSSCVGNKGGTPHVVAACTTLLKAEDITPAQQSRLLRARGWAYYCGKQYEDAISDYNEALALRPDDAKSILNRALALDAMGDSRAAEADYSKVLQINPDSIYALYSKAKFDQRHSNLAAAIQGYERVLEIDPGYKGVVFQLVDAYFDQDGIDGANQFLKRAQERWPNEKWVYFAQIIHDLINTGDPESALEAAGHYARLEPGVMHEAFMPALIHMKIGDEDKGIDFVQKFADRTVQQGLAGSSFFKRWYRITSNWMVYGQNEEWLIRCRTYATLGRTDLAKAEIDAFLEETGQNGRKIMLIIIRGEVSISEEAQSGSTEDLEDAIVRYLDHLANTSDFQDLGPPERARAAYE